MAIVIIRQDGKIDTWKRALMKNAPTLKIYSYLEDHPREQITMAIVWKHPEGSLQGYPNLACIASFGAGVDFLFEDPALPRNIPVTRVVDPVLASDMSEFVLARILGYLKHFNQYARDQANTIWNPMEYRRIADVEVGIMGVGALGKVLGEDLVKLGFRVRGWSASPRKVRSIQMFSGQHGLPAFLKQSDILVCLLPLTPATRGILNRSLFQMLPRGAFVINVARGGHLVDNDLLAVLQEGHLSGAALDVFHEEPLSEEHPFWTHPAICISPHIASVSHIDSVVPQLLENYNRLQKGQPLQNVVSGAKGY